jgi:hypothetical protein
MMMMMMIIIIIIIIIIQPLNAWPKAGELFPETTGLASHPGPRD